MRHLTVKAVETVRLDMLIWVCAFRLPFLFPFMIRIMKKYTCVCQQRLFLLAESFAELLYTVKYANAHLHSLIKDFAYHN